MKKHGMLSISTGLLLATVIGGHPAAQPRQADAPGVSPDTRTTATAVGAQASVDYLNGGIGKEQADAMRAMGARLSGADDIPPNAMYGRQRIRGRRSSARHRQRRANRGRPAVAGADLPAAGAARRLYGRGRAPGQREDATLRRRRGPPRPAGFRMGIVKRGHESTPDRASRRCACAAR